MGRPSKLNPEQWEVVKRRLMAGEKAADLAREFKVSPALICTRVSKRVEVVRNVATGLIDAEQALRNLPVSEQLNVLSLVDELRAVSVSLASAGKFGAATANSLASLANAQVIKIDAKDPMQSTEVLQGISALTKMANEASVIGRDLLALNKDMLKAGAGDAQTSADVLKELVKSLPL